MGRSWRAGLREWSFQDEFTNKPYRCLLVSSFWKFCSRGFALRDFWVLLGPWDAGEGRESSFRLVFWLPEQWIYLRSTACFICVLVVRLHYKERKAEQFCYFI